MALTQRELDKMGCCDCGKGAHPHHESVILSGACHKGAPTIAAYDSDTGCLLIACSVCTQPVVAILVAANADSPGAEEEQ